MLGIVANGTGGRVKRLAVPAHRWSSVTRSAIVLENRLAIGGSYFTVLVAVGQGARSRFGNVHLHGQRLATRGAVHIDQFRDLPSFAAKIHCDMNLAVGSGRECPGLARQLCDRTAAGGVYFVDRYVRR